jgi:hypothetical protein
MSNYLLIYIRSLRLQNKVFVAFLEYQDFLSYNDIATGGNNLSRNTTFC